MAVAEMEMENGSQQGELALAIKKKVVRKTIPPLPRKKRRGDLDDEGNRRVDKSLTLLTLGMVKMLRESPDGSLFLGEVRYQ